MNRNLTELVFILDKSGSMQGLEKDTIGGFNSMLKKQQKIKGDCNITTVLFNDKYELLHDRLNIKSIDIMTNEEYKVGGMTALLDAVGMTIDKIVNVQKRTADEYKAKKVMFVIITDGEENSSKEYSPSKVKNQIEYQTQKFNWEFVFLGANIDAVETANKIGIKENRATNFHADEEGVALNFEVMNEAILCLREEKLKDNWADAINKDFKTRS